MCGGNGTGALLPIRRVLLFRRSLRSPYVLTHTHTHDLLTRKSLVHDGAQSKNPRAPDSRHYYSKPLASQPSYRLTIIACIKCIDFHAARATGGKTGRTDAHTHTDRRRVLWRACARITIHVFPYGSVAGMKRDMCTWARAPRRHRRRRRVAVVNFALITSARLFRRRRRRLQPSRIARLVRLV